MVRALFRIACVGLLVPMSAIRSQAPVGFWASPITYRDFVILRIRESLREAISPFAEHQYQAFFRGASLPTGDPTRASYDAATGRIAISVEFTVGESLKPREEICSAFLDIIASTIGAGYPRWARNNVWSHFLPPSALSPDTAALGKAYDEMQARIDARVVVLEVSRKEQYWCQRPVLSKTVTVRTGDVR